MCDSKGSTPNFAPVVMYKNVFFVYFVWAQIGCLSRFGIQMSIISPRIFRYILEIPEETSGNFEANIMALAILSALLGFLFANLLYSFHLLALHISIVVSFSMVILLVFVTMLERKIAVFLYVLIIVITCYLFGAIDMIGIGTVYYPGIYGSPEHRMLAFLIGHSFGYLLMLIIISVIELGGLGSLTDNIMNIAFVYIFYYLFILLFLFATIASFMNNHLNSNRSEYIHWQESNVINSPERLSEGLKILRKNGDIIVMLVFLESSEAIFNSETVLFLTKPYPQFDCVLKSILLVIVHGSFDLFGRCFAHMLKKLVDVVKVDENEEPKTVDGKENIVHGQLKNLVLHVPSIWISKIPQLRIWGNIRKIRKIFIIFTVFMLIRWAVFVELMLERHYQTTLSFRLGEKIQYLLCASVVNSTVRGFMLAFVYFSLYEIGKSYYYGKIVNKFKHYGDSPSECYAIYSNSTIAISFFVTIVRVIEMLFYVFWTYLSFKYRRVLFEVEMVYEQTGMWATDNIQDNFSKFLWWIKMVFKLIWRDIRSPFDLL